MTYEEALCHTDRWETLEEPKKLEVLQAVENQMALEAGRPSCPVEGRWLYTGQDGITLGAFSPGRQTIYINTSQFDPDARYGRDPDRILTACIHEGRHAYQHQVAEGLVTHPDPEEAESWKENLSDDNYISYKENPVAYYLQPVEADARSFAEDRMVQLQQERTNALANAPNLETARQVFDRQMTAPASSPQEHSQTLAADESLGV